MESSMVPELCNRVCMVVVSAADVFCCMCDISPWLVWEGGMCGISPWLVWEGGMCDISP